MSGFASASNGTTNIVATTATVKHDDKSQRWTAHQLVSGGRQFTLNSVISGQYIANGSQLVGASIDFAVWFVSDRGNGLGHAVPSAAGYLQIRDAGQVVVGGGSAGFAVFSVNYNGRETCRLSLWIESTMVFNV
jgi:hypothetical protein